MTAQRDRAAFGPLADGGSATVWLLTAITVVILAGSVALTLAVIGGARQRAAGAADLAALAAASESSADRRQACTRAARVATANGASLRACHVGEDPVVGESVDVVVTVALPGPLEPFGPLAARSRAGPWEGGPGAYVSRTT